MNSTLGQRKRKLALDDKIYNLKIQCLKYNYFQSIAAVQRTWSPYNRGKKNYFGGYYQQVQNIPLGK